MDEGNDFEPGWFKLIAKMVDPQNNTLLVLYDDAQKIYGGRNFESAGKKVPFSFKSVGIKAQGQSFA
jgi:hypothetical protein